MSTVMIGFNPTGDIVEAQRGAQARLLPPNIEDATVVTEFFKMVYRGGI